MRRILYAVAVAGLMSAPAYAQFNLGGDAPRSKTRYTEQEKKEEAEREARYQNTLRGDKQAPTGKYDPWAVVRPTTTNPGQERR